MILLGQMDDSDTGLFETTTDDISTEKSVTRLEMKTPVKISSTSTNSQMISSTTEKNRKLPESNVNMKITIPTIKSSTSTTQIQFKNPTVTSTSNPTTKTAINTVRISTNQPISLKTNESNRNNSKSIWIMAMCVVFISFVCVSIGLKYRKMSNQGQKTSQIVYVSNGQSDDAQIDISAKHALISHEVL